MSASSRVTPPPSLQPRPQPLALPLPWVYDGHGAIDSFDGGERRIVASVNRPWGKGEAGDREQHDNGRILAASRRVLLAAEALLARMDNIPTDYQDDLAVEQLQREVDRARGTR